MSRTPPKEPRSIRERGVFHLTTKGLIALSLCQLSIDDINLANPTVLQELVKETGEKSPNHLMLHMRLLITARLWLHATPSIIASRASIVAMPRCTKAIADEASQTILTEISEMTLEDLKARLTLSVWSFLDTFHICRPITNAQEGKSLDDIENNLRHINLTDELITIFWTEANDTMYFDIKAVQAWSSSQALQNRLHTRSEKESQSQQPQSTPKHE